MKRSEVRLVLYFIGIAAASVAMSDALAWATKRADRSWTRSKPLSDTGWATR